MNRIFDEQFLNIKIFTGQFLMNSYLCMHMHMYMICYEHVLMDMIYDINNNGNFSLSSCLITRDRGGARIFCARRRARIFYSSRRAKIPWQRRRKNILARGHAKIPWQRKLKNILGPWTRQNTVTEDAQEYFAPVDAPKYRDRGGARIFCASRRAKIPWWRRRKNILRPEDAPKHCDGGGARM